MVKLQGCYTVDEIMDSPNKFLNIIAHIKGEISRVHVGTGIRKKPIDFTVSGETHELKLGVKARKDSGLDYILKQNIGEEVALRVEIREPALGQSPFKWAPSREYHVKEITFPNGKTFYS